MAYVAEGICTIIKQKNHTKSNYFEKLIKHIF